MKRRAISQMLGALILMAIVLVGAVLVYNYVWGASGRIAGAPGVSISGASLVALPGGGGYLRVSITNAGGVTGLASVALYSSSGQVFSAPGAPGQYYRPLQVAPGQVVTASYTIASGISPGGTYTVVVTLTTPRGTATASATVIATP